VGKAEGIVSCQTALARTERSPKVDLSICSLLVRPCKDPKFSSRVCLRKKSKPWRAAEDTLYRLQLQTGKYNHWDRIMREAIILSARVLARSL